MPHRYRRRLYRGHHLTTPLPSCIQGRTKQQRGPEFAHTEWTSRLPAASAAPASPWSGGDSVFQSGPPRSTASTKGSPSTAPTPETTARCRKRSISIFSRNLRCTSFLCSAGSVPLESSPDNMRCKLQARLIETTIASLAQSLHSSHQDLDACQCRKVKLIACPQVPDGIYNHSRLVTETLPIADFLVLTESIQEKPRIAYVPHHLRERGSAYRYSKRSATTSFHCLYLR